MTPSEILRNRLRAMGVDCNNEQAQGCVDALRAQGFKITARDIGESREVVLDFGPEINGARDAKLCSQEPQIIWQKIWDEMA
jgi:hypothetical protein